MEDIGMELSETNKMAVSFSRMAREKLEGKVSGFCIFNVNDDVNHREFSVDFIAYNYFPVRLNYEKGRFGCCISYGEKSISLENTQQWWDEADFDLFFKELQSELELRIPDKYLSAHGWL